MPAIVNINEIASAAAAATERIHIDESIGLIITATGGNVATALPEFTPILFRRASVQAAALTGADITRAIQDEDWSGVFWRAQEATPAGIQNTGDPIIRAIFAQIDDELIVVRIPNGAAGAPPTDANIERGIAAMSDAETSVGRKPGIVFIPEFNVPRSTVSPYAPIVPPGGNFSALGYLSELNGLAEDNDAIGLISGAGLYTRAQAIDWAEANRADHLEALWPRVRGTDATIANSLDPSTYRAIAILEQENRHTGRGTPLSAIPAPGVNGVVPGISQSLTSDSADTALLTDAGITTLIHQRSQFYWIGGTFNQDVTGGPSLAEITSVERLKQEIIELLEVIAFEGLTSGLPVSRAFFERVEQHGTRALARYVAANRLSSGSVVKHPTQPTIRNGTVPQFQVELGMYVDAQALTFDLIPRRALLVA